MAKKEMQLEEPVKMYGGKVTMRFDRANWKWYREEGEILYPFDGVTSILHMIDKSLYLVPWAAKMMYVAVMQRMVRREDADGRVFSAEMPWGDFDALMLQCKGAHKEKLEDAGDVGELAHNWLSRSIKQSIENNDGFLEMDEIAPCDERAYNCGMAAHRWSVAHNARWISTERPVASLHHVYAGTMDGSAIIDSCNDPQCCPRIFTDELTLIDFKSSNQLSIDYLLQTAAYQNAAQEEDPSTVYGSRTIIRLGKEKGELEVWTETNFEEDFEAYLSCLRLARDYNRVKDRLSAQKKLKTFNKRAEKKLTKEEEADRKKKMKLAKRTKSVVQ